MKVHFDAYESHDCSYLEHDIAAKSHYMIIENCPEELAYELLIRGFRRFGSSYFRPICDGCEQCESMRIIVDGFTPSKSMKRVQKKNQLTKVFIKRPSLDVERVELFNRYHLERSENKGWRPQTANDIDYYRMLVDGMGEYGYEVDYFIDGKLAGADFIDIHPSGISSVYFISEPEFKEYSLGTYSLLVQMNIAKKMQIPHIYLGWVVRKNESLKYKLRYEPYEILHGRPLLGEEPNWSLENAGLKTSGLIEHSD